MQKESRFRKFIESPRCQDLLLYLITPIFFAAAILAPLYSGPKPYPANEPDVKIPQNRVISSYSRNDNALLVRYEDGSADLFVSDNSSEPIAWLMDVDGNETVDRIDTSYSDRYITYTRSGKEKALFDTADELFAMEKRVLNEK